MEQEYHLLLKNLSGDLPEIARQTLKVIGEEKVGLFVQLANDWIDIYGAVSESYSGDERIASLVQADFHGLFKEIKWFERLFFWGNYPGAFRNLRYVWEMLFRAFYADMYSCICPQETDGPGPSVDDKIAWLEERKLN